MPIYIVVRHIAFDEMEPIWEYYTSLDEAQRIADAKGRGLPHNDGWYVQELYPTGK